MTKGSFSPTFRSPAQNALLWTAFFFGSLIIEEVSLALWNGYSLTATVSFNQMVTFPAIFALGLVVTTLLRPFLLIDFAPYKRTAAIIFLCCATFLVVLLLVPPYRSGLGFLLAMVFYSNWWHPVQNRLGFYLASLPWLTATVVWAFLTQYRQVKSHLKRLLFMCSAISFILLTTSGIDNSLCLGEWDGGLRPKHSMKSGDFYGVALDLKAENQGGFGPFYQTYKDKSEPETGKLYHAIYHGSIMWTQNGRVLQIYKAN